ncbi:MAG TPA: DUF2225 domain-containing protein [Armatimonadota bacterium]|nr:DUF2225 domain-containing protein [Armatimonadota bacterium]
MTTSKLVDVTCPCCGATFEACQVTSSNTFGPLTTDLHSMAGGLEPLLIAVQACYKCGYAGYLSVFDKDVTVPPDVKAQVLRELAPRTREKPIYPALAYEFYATLEAWRGAGEIVVGDLFLRAAWCCRMDGPAEDEPKYRRAALERFENALAADDATEMNVPVYTYLVGELHRRLGNDQAASTWYARAGTLVADIPELAWLGAVIEQQMTDPQEFIDRRGLDM